MKLSGNVSTNSSSRPQTPTRSISLSKIRLHSTCPRGAKKRRVNIRPARAANKAQK
ncbi:hypothetical protein D3C86_2229020 [compost metagenome]